VRLGLSMPYLEPPPAPSDDGGIRPADEPLPMRARDAAWSNCELGENYVPRPVPAFCCYSSTPKRDPA